LPEVHLVNLREEYKAGNRGLFSRLLKEKIASALKQHEQIILYINRRGQATLIRCNNCGYVMVCKRCSIVLTYHLASNRLICHHCRRAYLPLKTCPKCFKGDIKYLGIGTETVESECRKLYPAARILRFDSDLATKIKDYEDIIHAYSAHKADILIGTQMVAKGLDFPRVSLVGVVNADIGLNIPDLRSAERTFQLLCQVSGRAGRGFTPGEAVIQTYNPTHYAIKYAAQQDYLGFYSEEIRYRRSFGYPPFSQMVRLLYSHSNLEKCRESIEKMRAAIINIKERKGVAGLKIVGPYPMYISRLRGKYQMQIVLLSQDRNNILEDVKFSAGWIVDVDPVGMV
jgi:primosomal protein N' (replication factor Y)